MLTISDIAPFSNEQLDVDPYIPLSLSWESEAKSYGEIVYWRTGDLEASLLEIGIDPLNGQLRSLTVTQVDSIANKPIRIDDDLPKGLGIPTFDTTDWPEQTIIDEKQPFHVQIDEQAVVIDFNSDTKNVSAVVADRVTFVVDAHQQLAQIVVTNLTTDEFSQLRETFNFITQ